MHDPFQASQCKLEWGKRFLSMKDETHNRIPLEVSWQRVPHKLAGKVIPNSQYSKGNPKINRKKRKEIGQSRLGK